VTEDTLKGKYYDKKRIPAYTDRVLFRSLPGFVGNLRLQVWCASSSLVAIAVHLSPFISCLYLNSARNVPLLALSLSGGQSYESIESASTSDHKPVRAAFELETTSGPLDILNDPQGTCACHWCVPLSVPA